MVDRHVHGVLLPSIQPEIRILHIVDQTAIRYWQFDELLTQGVPLREIRMLELVDGGRVAAISALLTEFCWCADHGMGDLIAALFTEDAFIKTPHFEVHGIDEIRFTFASRPPKLSRHNWMNLRVSAHDGEHYTAETNMITATGPFPAPQAGGNIAITTAVDEIVFRDGSPLFVSRTLTVAFEGMIVAKAAAA